MSPVIGVILMVAITVILAAVIATFVLGLGDRVSDTAPQATFDVSYDEDAGEVTVTHASGETLNSDQISLNGQTWTDANGYANRTEVSSGDSATISASPGDTVRLSWTNEQGTNSATIRTYEVPT
ncbi:type IV pilin N-terminal domain-containing protein [Salinibaculum salinum]|uniref:type IV pilin N-terminal domain-containing protein n=1 Tax=Salinibaculum salinum TaxID=3131996 RepID=UPI0030ECABDB